MTGLGGTTLRRAGPEDRATLIGFLQALNQFEAAIQDDRTDERAAAERCYEQMLAKIAVHGGAVILAQAAGEAAGFLAWRIEEDEPYVRDELVRHAEIAELYVEERFRRSGVARALMAEAERMIRAEKLPRLFIGLLDGNDAAEATYREMGYAPYAKLLVKDLG